MKGKQVMAIRTMLLLISLIFIIDGALAEVQFQTYTTNCQSERDPIRKRVEGILIPSTLNTGTNQVVNLNFYFHGINWDGQNSNPLNDYVQKMGLVEAITSQSPENEVVIIFSGAKNHEEDTAYQWMSGKRMGPESQFNCFYQEALNTVVQLGYNPQSISFFGHSNGVHVIKNIMDSGFLDEGGILPIKDIVSFDGCYGEWCTDIEDKFAERGNLVSIYAYYLKGSAANSKTDTETNAKALVEKYPLISSVFEVEDSAHNDVPQECLFSHVVDDSCGGKAVQLSLTERASQTSATTTPDSIEASIPLSPPKEGISDRAREIDRVWKDLGPRIRGSTDVWDTYLNMWVAFEYLYPSATLSAFGFQTVTVPARESVQSTASDKTQCLIENFGWYGSGNKEPQLATVTLGGKSFKANNQIVAAIQKVAPVIESSGYKIQSVVGACRLQKEGNAVQPPDCGSLHVSCLAIDINPLRNPHCPSWADKLSTPDERARCQRGEIVTDLPPQVINAFEENGFYWGGRFGSSTGKPTPDAMHFEYVGKPGETVCCPRTYRELTYSYGSAASGAALAGSPNPPKPGKVYGLDFSDTTYIPAARTEAQNQGIDPCFMVVVMHYESRGLSYKVGIDANVADCNVASRRKLLLDKSAGCKQEYGGYSEANSKRMLDDCNSRTQNACLNQITDTKNYRLDLPTEEQRKNFFCSNQFDSGYTYGIGLGQITPDIGRTSKELGGVTYTHCDLFDHLKNIKATVAHLKADKANVGQSPEQLQNVYTAYTGSAERAAQRTQSHLACRAQMGSS